MTAQTELHSLAGKVGEISGQLRELIHQQNNMAQKLDGLTERLLTSPTRADFDALGRRADALEAARNRDDGAKGVLAGLINSKAFGGVMVLLIAAYVAIKEGLFK